MRTLQIGNLMPRLPIIQGGMGVGVSLSGLAAAVANRRWHRSYFRYRT